MFIGEKRRDDHHPSDSQFSQSKAHHQSDQKRQHQQVEDTSHLQGATDPDVSRDRVQIRLAVEFVVLAGIENVEAANPERNSRSQQQNADIQCIANGNPSRRRGNPQRESQDKVRPARKTFGIRVKQKDSERDRRKDQRQMIQLRCRQDENRARDDHESRHERVRKRPGRKSSRTRPRIRGIYCRVGNAVKRHRRRSCRDHCNNNPSQLVTGWPAARGQHRAAERKRESKYRMLPLDHLERRVQVVQDCHVTILASPTSRFGAKRLTLVSSAVAGINSNYSRYPCSPISGTNRQGTLSEITGRPWSFVTTSNCWVSGSPTGTTSRP